MTISSLIASSLRLIGVLAAGETLEAQQGADALVVFSQMLDSWSTERLTVYAQTRTPHVLSSGTQRYTIGSGGTFAEARPLWIDAVGLMIGSFEYPLSIYSRREWAAIANKSLAGIPEGIYYNPDYPLGAIDVWPVPDTSTYSLVLYTPAASLTSASSLLTDLSLPPGWAGALRYNLAVELAPEYDVTPSVIVLKGADEKKADIKRTNILDERLEIDDALLRPGSILSTRTGNIY